MSRLIKVLCGLTVLSLALVIWADDMVRYYVESKYPGVEVQGDVKVFRGTIRLTNVHVTRPTVSGVLDEVLVDLDKNVEVHGGKLDVDLTDADRSEAPSGGTTSIKVDGVWVNLTKGDLQAALNNVSLNEREVCFTFGTLMHPKGSADVHDGCARRDRSLLSAAVVEMNVPVPTEVPHLGDEVAVTAYWVDVFPAKKRAEARVIHVEDRSQTAFSAAAETLVGLLGDETISISADNYVIHHRWIGVREHVEQPIVALLPKTLFEKRSGEIQLAVGDAIVQIDPFQKAIRGDAPCGDWVDVIPNPAPALKKAKEHFTGDLSFEVRLEPKPSLKIDSTCRFKCSKGPIGDVKFVGFSYDAYHPDGTTFERRTGRASADWTPLQDLPHHVPEAFILLEDPGFKAHRGVSTLALENSLKLNIEQGRFVRGGSTITMQLAKNLWLSRDKTITRKAEEALLTYALESCLSKAEILEMYVNVVEFGPDVYGIAAGARHHFKKSPSELTPDEAFYLASILPAPRKALPPEQGGLDKARRIMKMLAKSGFISEFLLTNDDAVVTAGWDVAP